MSVAQQVNTLNAGLTLVRHYDPDYDLEQQCGSLSYYQALEDQLLYGPLSYFNQSDGNNKFMLRFQLHVFHGGMQLPIPPHPAYCFEPVGDSGTSEIHIRYLADQYAFPAAISHEVGHAHHNWCKVFSMAGLSAEFSRFWEQQVAVNGTRYDPTVYPWKQANGQVETPYEQYANAYRFFQGTLSTRGSSGSGSPDPVLPGFRDPAANPHWGKQLKILPELAAFVASHGIMANTLSWQGGEYGYWQFRRQDGVWVAQTDYYVWYEWKNSSWSRYYPAYVRD